MYLDWYCKSLCEKWFEKYGYHSKPGTDFYSIEHIFSSRTPPFDLLEGMESLFSPKIENIDQSTTATNGGCVNKRVTTNTSKEDSNKHFSEILIKMTTQVVEQYNEKEDQHFLLQMPTHCSRTQNVDQNLSELEPAFPIFRNKLHGLKIRNRSSRRHWTYWIADSDREVLVGYHTSKEMQNQCEALYVNLIKLVSKRREPQNWHEKSSQQK